MAIPAREQMYYVITMPLDIDGQGPCDLKDAEKLTYEVWDQELTSYIAFNYLADAIDDCNQRNERHQKLLEGDH